MKKITAALFSVFICLMISFTACKKSSPTSVSVPSVISTGTPTITCTQTVRRTSTVTATPTITATFTATATATNSPVCGIIAGNSTDDNNDYGTGGGLWVIAFTAPENATLASISCKLNCAYANPISMGLYSSNSGAPGGLIVQSSSITSLLTGWNTAPIPPTDIASGAVYFLAAYCGTYCQPLFRDTTNPSDQVLYLSYYNANGTLPSTITGFTPTGNLQMKIYAGGCEK